MPGCSPGRFPTTNHGQMRHKPGRLPGRFPLAQIFHVLSYEAHPGLWYVCLWVLSRLHVSYVGMHWVCGGDWIFGCSGAGDHFALSPLHQTAAALHVLPGLSIRDCGAQLRVGAAVDLSLRIFLAATLQRPLTDRFVPGTSGQCRTACRRDLGWLCHRIYHRPLVEARR